jgi:soluble lytic murein transglycosylase
MEPIQGQPVPAPVLSRGRLLWLAVLLLVGLGLVDWWLGRRKEQRYDAQILSVAKRYQVNPALVKAVVWRESNFNPKARGRVGEIGLMQIRPLTAQEWVQAVLRRRTFEGNLFEPETNLEVGTWYLGKLLKRYARTDNPIPYALADYNAGRSNVLRWKKGAAETNSAVFIEQVTFPATREYITAIVRRAERYEAAFRAAQAKQGARLNPGCWSAFAVPTPAVWPPVPRRTAPEECGSVCRRRHDSGRTAKGSGNDPSFGRRSSSACNRSLE